MAKLPQQPDNLVDKSLQINIDSEDDAKAVVQHLGKIRETWEMLSRTVGITSVEFCIAEPLRKKVEPTLMGAIRWCRTYTKSVAAFDGNVLFPLPHYISVAKPATPVAAKVIETPKAVIETTPVTEAPVKSKRLVRAELTGT